jgi:hypothetical protein
VYFCKRKDSIWLALLLLRPLQAGNEILYWRELFDTFSRSFAMTLIQELMNQAAVGGLLNAQTIKRFSPAEIRETIQSLVATEQMALASALGDAGLSIYPHSEDMLAISSLLAMTNQDWQLAVELIEELVEIQGDKTPPFTLVMFVRALRCNLDPERALAVARHGLSLYPGQLELQAEMLSLDDFSQSMMPSTSGMTH